MGYALVFLTPAQFLFDFDEVGVHRQSLLLLECILGGDSERTGEVAEGAVRADLTVTFDSYKPLHTAVSSAPLCGKIVCADIGIRDEWHPEF